MRFSFEARSQSVETLEAFYDLFLSECGGISEERGVTFKLDRRIESAPAIMDAGWIERLYPWEVEVDVSGLPFGHYTFVALTDDPSGGTEGFGPASDTRTIIVR